MRTILVLLLSSLSCFAQYRYSTYSIPSTTNTVIASNAMTTFNTACDVAGSTRAYIRLSYKLTSQDTNANHAKVTNHQVFIGAKQGL